MMRRLLLFFFLCGVLTTSAQTLIRDVFKQMPDSIVPYLTANNRLDFIDFIDSNMKAEVTNSLGGKSELVKLTDSYLNLVLNASASLQMRLLDVTEPVDSASQIICFVRTFGTDIQESIVDFYSLKWKPLPLSGYLKLPAGMFVATLGDEAATLTITPVTRLDPPANEEQKEIIEKSTILKWKNKFVNDN